MKPLIATWIYLDSDAESSVYPQVGKLSHLEDFQMIYWQCVAVFFEYSVRHNPSAKHVLFSNQTPAQLPLQNGFSWAEHLERLGVELVTLPLTWQTPPGYHGAWRNQFYIFDILQFFERQAYDDNTPLLVFDSDCIINQPLDTLFKEIHNLGLLVLPMPFTSEYNINGITRKSMRELYTILDNQDPGIDPVYYGGEVFAATPLIVNKINERMPYVWALMQNLHSAGKPKFTEEAHFLSYFYFHIEKIGSLEPYMRRIWTSPRYNDVEPSDIQLPIWHLPSEKKGGIAILFHDLTSKIPLPISTVKLGGIFGLSKRTRYLDLKHYIKYTPFYRWWLKLSGT
ncbi:MAG: hypothetical protein ACKVU2_14135 [Saprospiraceae bacterium]